MRVRLQHVVSVVAKSPFSKHEPERHTALLRLGTRKELNLQHAGAVAQAFRADVQAVEEGEMQVGDGNSALEVDVPAGRQLPVAFADHQDGQVLVEVAIAVG